MSRSWAGVIVNLIACWWAWTANAILSEALFFALAVGWTLEAAIWRPRRERTGARSNTPSKRYRCVVWRPLDGEVVHTSSWGSREKAEELALASRIMDRIQGVRFETYVEEEETPDGNAKA